MVNSVDFIVKVEGGDKHLTSIHRTSRWSSNSVHGNGTQAILQILENLPRGYYNLRADMSVHGDGVVDDYTHFSGSRNLTLHQTVEIVT